MTRRRQWWIIGFGILAVSFIGGAALWQSKQLPASAPVPNAPQETQSNRRGAEQFLTQMGLKPTPMPYAELTIPALRERTYTSQLSELRQVRQSSTYTTFLTAYDSDGFRINGLLTQPTGEPPANGWPAIVFIHGYIPPDEYRTQEKYVEYVDYLARNGFVVFKIDLRGHGDSEGEAAGAYYSTDYVIDALNARAALQAAEFVDTDRVGLWGHSMAGNVVLRSVAVRPDIPAAVIWAGAVFTYEDFAKYRIQDNSYQPPSSPTPSRQRRQAILEMYGEVSLDSPFWQQVSPKQYLGDLQTRIQLHHAVNDDVVDIGYSRDLAPLLEQSGVEHELHEYSSGGHNISGGSFSTAMRRTVEFFQKM